MSSQRYTPDFKDEAVRQIVDRDYSVTEVSERLGVSAHSLYKWVKAVKPDKTEEQAAALIEAKSEVLKLRAQLRRTEEERDILKKAARRPRQGPNRAKSGGGFGLHSGRGCERTPTVSSRPRLCENTSIFLVNGTAHHNDCTY
jgi:transposase